MFEFKMGMVGPDEDGEEIEMSEEREEISKVSPVIAENRTKVSTSLPNRKLMTFTEVYNSDSELEFIIPDVISKSGIIFLGGLSGTGKTILAIQVVANIVLGRPTMTWELEKDLPQMRALMFSLEMGERELKRRLSDMYPELTEVESKTLEDNFLIYCDSEPFHLWEDAHAAEMILLIKASQANVALIDSASVSFANNLNDIEQVNKSLSNLKTIAIRLNIAIIVVAHTRKPSQGMSTSPEDSSLSDLFGHSGVAQYAASVYLLIEDESSRRDAIKNNNGAEVDKIVHFINAKNRFGSSNAAFKANLTSRKSTLDGSPLQFKRNVYELPRVTDEQRRLIKQNRGSLAGSLAHVDFTVLSGDDDI